MYSSSASSRTKQGADCASSDTTKIYRVKLFSCKYTSTPGWPTHHPSSSSPNSLSTEQLLQPQLPQQLLQPQLPQQLLQPQLPQHSLQKLKSTRPQQNKPYAMVSLRSNAQKRTSRPGPTDQTKRPKKSAQPARGQRSATRDQSSASHGRGGGVVGQQGSHNSRHSTHSNEDESDESDIPIGFTLDNFESQLGNWTKTSLRQALSNRSKNNSNRVPPEVQEVLNLQKINYSKIKLMLALIGRVSERTLNTSIGENKPPRRKCGYNRFLAFSVKSAETPVPPKGCSIGWDERNTTLGAAWKALTAHQQEVFDAKIFSHFSKLPVYSGEDGIDDDDNDDTTNNDDSLTADEIQLYDPLYEDLVNHEKVKLVSGKGLEESTNAGPQALKHLIRINSELFTISNAYNLTFYLLSATRYPGSGSFCKELSNDPYWLPVAKDRWKAKETFEAYSHAREIQEVVNESRTNLPPAKKSKPSDETRSTLRKKLNQLLGNALGCDEESFPKSASPASLLSERYPASKYPNLKMVRSEESQLSDEMFTLGLEAMKTKFRKQWLADIENGHFKITNTVETNNTTETNTTKTNTTETNTTETNTTETNTTETNTIETDTTQMNTTNTNTTKP
ncbi:hypothetical protein PSTG_08139 [Puccinia striiformis f. sp. tritici PST-78]|uniref:Uncharacterized protein n=1 Tax=Puccinia striiformis f. sp. tritici PST-78 TaxID=1165861 RepID=A0A0L0VH64_9BASI|nr:hypothetical protein PSTG_08139 [Puccinia striiformis f. sp. tritici PST-78]